MAIDRSKFKSTSVAAVVQQDKDVSSMTKTKNDRAGYLKIEAGKNVFRVFPAHPEDGGISFVEPKSTVWLPMMVEERDSATGQVLKGADGNVLLKEGNKSVFNSRIHGGTDKDLVEEYFKMAEEWAKKHKFDADPKEDVKKRKTYTDKLWGNFAAKVQGIRYNHNWVMYAKKLSDNKQPFGLVEMRPSMKDGINKVVNIEASNQPIGTEATDPFTDLEEGRALVIFFNDKAEKPADYYSVSIDTTTEPAEMNGRKIQIQKVYPLTEEDLEMLLKFPSLYKTFVNCFKKRDFLLQYSGLEFFDKKNGMGIFGSPEFEAVIEEIAAYYPEDAAPTKEEIEETIAETEEGEKEEEEAEEADTDQFTLMSREELKKYNVDNKAGILVKPSMTDDVLRDRLREWTEAMKEGNEEEEAEEPAATVVETVATPVAEKEVVKETAPETNTAAPAISAADKLKAMKARQAAKTA